MENIKFSYTANFCEENIWHLCQHSSLIEFTKKVIYVSNKFKNCAFWNQKSPNSDEIVWWDYHVILLATSPSEKLIFDFDSTLAFPSTLDYYLKNTFKDDNSLNSNDLPFFKVIDAAVYIDSFYSDRQHMKDSKDNWFFEPPKSTITNTNKELILQDLLDFSETSKHPIYDLEEILNT